MSKTKITRRPHFTRGNFERLLEAVETLTGQLEAAEHRAKTAESTVEELKERASVREEEFRERGADAASLAESFRAQLERSQRSCQIMDDELNESAEKIDELTLLSARSHQALVDVILAKRTDGKSQGGDSSDASASLLHLIMG